MSNTYVRIGAILAGLAVAFGAFGAHTLKGTLSSDDLAVFETGVRYQMYHGLGILIVALLSDKLSSAKLTQWCVRLLFVGTILFSGSLYALTLSGTKVLGAITPIGGVLYLAGWLCLILAARRPSR